MESNFENQKDLAIRTRFRSVFDELSESYSCGAMTTHVHDETQWMFQLGKLSKDDNDYYQDTMSEEESTQFFSALKQELAERYRETDWDAQLQLQHNTQGSFITLSYIR